MATDIVTTARILAMVVLLLCSLSEAAAQRNNTPFATAAGDLHQDYDGDGIPDRLGRTVSIRGRISVSPGAVSGDNALLFVQDETAGILVYDRQGFDVTAGDSVEVTGVVAEIDNQVAINANAINRISAGSAAHIPVAVFLDDGEADLDAYAGKRVETIGDVIDMGRDDRGAYYVINRTGGPLMVRVPPMASREDLPAIKRNDHLRVKGVLAPAGDARWPIPRVIVTSAADIAPTFPLDDWLPMVVWIGSGLALLGLGFLFLRSFAFISSARRKPFRAIFEQAGDAMLVVDGKLKIIEANKSACKLVRQSYAQIKFRKLNQLLKLANEGELASAIDGIQSKGRLSLEAGLWGDELQDVDLDVTLSRVKRRKGDYILAVLHDVTRHTDNVTQFKLFHEELLNGMPVEVSVLSSNGKYLYANGHGYGDAETQSWVVGKSDIELCERMKWSSEIALRRRAHRRRAITTGAPVQFEEIMTDQGITRSILRTYQPVFENQGKEIAAVACYGIDISELKESQRLLDVARHEIDKVGRLKESFLENINHEFRTPITGIIGFAEILEGEVPEEQREFVNLIERNGRRLMNTLNAVLDLAGLNNNEFDLTTQVLNVVEEISTAVESSREMAEEKGLFLKLEASRHEFLVRADQVCLARVIQNLIDNSIKFTEAGGIIIEVDTTDESVNIRVLDTGVGVESDFVPFMFDDFNQESLGADRAFQGVGIGLGITKRLVELMKGTISAESAKDEGSIFTVSLPRAFPKQSRFGPGKPRLLLVDDSADVNTMVHYVLDDHFAVDVATDLDTMDQMVRRSRYDVVMLDMGLGVFDTVEGAMNDIKERYEGLAVPVIAVDDRARRDTQEQSLAAGFNYYVAKPFKKQSLVGQLSDVMFDVGQVRVRKEPKSGDGGQPPHYAQSA